ncbi:MAG: cyclodeaminase/cyclohydrolase family protein [Cloacibacillus sp.]
MKITELSGINFVARLASCAPVPGGGGAAALVGAIGVALGNMVGSLTVGKQKYADVQQEILNLKARSDELQDKLLLLVEKDAEVFEPLSRAYGMPNETEEERTKKASVMAEALRKACGAPMEIMELCIEALEVIERFSQIGSKIAISDAGCAAVCCRAALSAASLNVFINTKAMADRAYAQQLNKHAVDMLISGTDRADAVFTAVMSQLK